MLLHLLSRARMRLIKISRSLTLKDPVIWGTLVVSLMFNGVLWVWLLSEIPRPSYPIPLHANIYFGVDYIDSWYKALFLPAFGLWVIVTNFFITYLLYLKERLLSYFCTTMTLLVHIFLLLAAYRIILLNG